MMTLDILFYYLSPVVVEYQLLMVELFVHSGQDYLIEELELDFVITVAQLPIIRVVHAPDYIDLQFSTIAPFCLILSDKDHNSILILATNSSPKGFFQLFLELFL